MPATPNKPNAATTKIAFIDKRMAGQLSEAMAAALKGFMDERGLEIRLDGLTYDRQGRFVCPKFTVKVAGTNPARDAFLKYAPLFGLKAEDMGTTVFESGGKKHRIAEWHMTGSARMTASFDQILVDLLDGRGNPTGKKYIFHARDVVKLLGRPDPDADLLIVERKDVANLKDVL